jgi:hypothetical protein
MAELLVFTILAAAAAVYAVLPKSRQLRVRYVFGDWYFYLATAGAIVIIAVYLVGVYLSTAEITFSLFCWVICFPALFWIELTQVGIASMITGFTLYRLWETNPVIRRDAGLARTIRSLYTEQNYDTLVSVIGDHYQKLIQDTSGSKAPASRATTERVLLDSHFTEQYAKLNPELGIRIIGDEQADIPREEFTKAFLTGLHNDESSILYHEIENNRNGEGSRYDIERENRLIRTLFSDCAVAKDVLAWKGIGDNTQQILDELYRSPDPYSDRRKRFSLMNDGTLVFRDPLFVSVRFFDIMVTEAVYQNIDHHMWIGYFDGFTKKICRNYELGDHADPTAEFPNDYSYILNEMVEVLTKIIGFAISDSDSVRTAASRPDINHESDIIKTCIRNLFICHSHILTADEIPAQFKQYLSNDVFDVYFELAECDTQECNMYHRVMRGHIVSDDPLNPIPSDNREEYLHRFLNHLGGYDTAQLITMSTGYDEYEDLQDEIRQQIS